MKKLMMMCLLMVFVFALFAEIMPVKTDKYTAVESDMSVKAIKTISRDVPEWEWNVTPQDLLVNYADYFQCYNHLPISLQSEANGGGIYIVYRNKDQAGISEISYTYVDNNGVVQASQGIGYVGYYPDAVVDQETGDVFSTWHVDITDGSGTYDVIGIYDLYHIMLQHGLWKYPVITVLDSDGQDELDPTFNDEFIWPQIEIGPSPIAGKQRVYIVASNNIIADGTEANPSENVMIMMADFEQADLDLQSDLEWTYNSVPMLDTWNSGSPYWYRPFKSFTVIDNQLIFMGYRISGDEAPDQDNQIFCFINDNYGEGDDWDEHMESIEFEQENPSYVDVESGDTHYLYSDLATTPTVPYTSVAQGLIHTGHFNLVPTHNNTAVTWAGAMGISFDSGDGPGYYIPLWYQIYPKTFTYDLVTETFSFCDVYPQGANPNDNIPMQPWDLDEDGEYDEIYDDGMPMWAQDWPIFHFDTEAAFHYNEYYLTSNPDTGYMAYIWVDGMMATEANEGTEGYESWVATPELTVVVSNDWGMTWSEPIFMNGNPDSDTYVSEMEGMIPCFAYPGDRIEDDGDGYGIVHLFFLDDNDYGSFHSQQAGLNNGSTFEYAAMRIYFGEPVAFLPPRSLTVVSNALENSATLTWNSPSSGDPTGYDVYLDDVLQGNTTDLEWIFTDLTSEIIYEAGLKAVYEDGISDMVTMTFSYEVSGADENELTVGPIESLNYPNPFNPTTTISFETQVECNVAIDIYNVKGQLINTLVNDTFDAGSHSLIWNGTDDNGNTVPSGVYFYKTKSGKYTTSKKMILMK